MPEGFIVDAVRSPVGRRGGALSEACPANLDAHSIRDLVEWADIDPGAVGDVVFSCVATVAPHAGDIARTYWLAAGLPNHVPGTTVDRQCGSSQHAVHLRRPGRDERHRRSGGRRWGPEHEPDSHQPGHDRRPGARLRGPLPGERGTARYGTEEVGQFRSAEMIAERWAISREDMDAFVVSSHERALVARAEGRFDQEIEPLVRLDHDEGPRRPDWDKIRGLPPLTEGGRVTAACASQISDASAAMLVASERAQSEHDMRPRARVHHLSVRGADPLWMLTAPIPATRHALAAAGIDLADIDLIEINETFASVMLGWQAETGADMARVNVSEGAISLGHPLRATSVRLMTTLLHELDRSGGRYGLQTMCEGDGQANVTILERLDA